MILSTFISPEDVLWQEADGKSIGTTRTRPWRPVAPPADAEHGGPRPHDQLVRGERRHAGLTNDWRYTVHVRRPAVGQLQRPGPRRRPGGVREPSVRDRPTGQPPDEQSANYVAGERVVQAVFGYGTNLLTVGTMPYDGNNTQRRRAAWIQQRDFAALAVGPPDLEIKTGSWVADVTYERRQWSAKHGFSTFRCARVRRRRGPAVLLVSSEAGDARRRHRRHAVRDVVRCGPVLPGLHEHAICEPRRFGTLEHGAVPRQRGVGVAVRGRRRAADLRRALIRFEPSIWHSSS